MCLFTLATGCAYLPDGFLPETDVQSPARLFVDDLSDDGIPVAEPQIATGPEKPGLKIRKSKRGNMESYVVRGQRYYTLDHADGYSARGVASWYGPNFHGRTASNGEVYDMYRLTAAHKTLPLPTYARVTHVENGRSVVVKVNDRGPFSGDRLIDLSFAAALRLGMVNDGTADVEIQALTPEEMMVLTGPENKLDIDFHRTLEVGQEEILAQAVKDPQPEGEEVVTVAAADIDQNPITAQPTTGIDTTSIAAAQPTAVAEIKPVAVAGLPVVVPARSRPEIPSDEEILAKVSVAVEAAGEPVATQGGELVALGELSQQVAAEQQADTDIIDEAMKEALMPVVADANVQPVVAVSASLQVADPSDGLVDDSVAELAADVAGDMAGDVAVKDAQESMAETATDDEFYVQAGVYASVSDAERIAFDVVLAAPGEVVNVKPLKDSEMYRITVGPVVSSDRASEVSGLLTEAGLDNFAVRVK